MPASALVLQTQDNCPPGLLGDWAMSRGLALDVLRVDRWSELPDPGGYDCAIASDRTRRSPARGRAGSRGRSSGSGTLSAGVPVLGICFGAQALAVALRGRRSRRSSVARAWMD